jgi:hypothetical protein|tara:strand:+ start:329 stop:598 length:270 start_codon:yes stop_codon:yes gene_type:complete
MSERAEVLMRLVVGLVSGIIVGLWKGLIQIIVVIHFIYALFTGKRNKDLAEFCDYWNNVVYNFLRYMTFCTNKRPFPFSSLGKNRDKVE